MQWLSVGGFLAEDSPAFEPVAGFHERVGGPVVVIRSKVAERTDRHLSRTFVPQEPSSEEADFLLPHQSSHFPVGGHPGARGEHRADSEEKSSDLESKAHVSALGVEELLLSEEVLLGGFNNLVASQVLGGGSLPGALEVRVPDSDSIVSGVGVCHCF